MPRLGKLRTGLALPAVLLAGCTWVTHHVELDYSAPIAPAAPAVEAAAFGATVAVVAVVDAREPSDILGVVRNGYGMRVASVVADGDTRAWVRDGLETELRHAGFDVVGAGGRVTIDVELTRMRCSAGPDYDAEVGIAAHVERGGEPLLGGHYRGRGSTGRAFTATTRELEQSLDLALQDALRQLIRDLRRRVLGID